MWPGDQKRDAASVGLCGGRLRPPPDPQQGGREARGGLRPRTDVGGAAADARASLGYPGKMDDYDYTHMGIHNK